MIAYWSIRSKIHCWNNLVYIFLFRFCPLFSVWARFACLSDVTLFSFRLKGLFSITVFISFIYQCFFHLPFILSKKGECINNGCHIGCISSGWVVFFLDLNFSNSQISVVIVVFSFSSYSWRRVKEIELLNFFLRVLVHFFCILFYILFFIFCIFEMFFSTWYSSLVFFEVIFFYRQLLFVLVLRLYYFCVFFVLIDKPGLEMGKWFCFFTPYIFFFLLFYFIYLPINLPVILKPVDCSFKLSLLFSSSSFF